jgi:hypothetical protein
MTKNRETIMLTLCRGETAKNAQQNSTSGLTICREGGEAIAAEHAVYPTGPKQEE